MTIKLSCYKRDLRQDLLGDWGLGVNKYVAGEIIPRAGDIAANLQESSA